MVERETVALPSRRRVRAYRKAAVTRDGISGTSATGNSYEGLPQQVDRAEDRGDHDDHRGGDAHRQNVIEHGVPS
jgi:hypothetical protein